MRIAIALIGSLWVHSVLAELPRPSAVPNELPDLKQRSALLRGVADSLEVRIGEHDAKCSRVPKGSVAAAACAKEMHELEAEVVSYIDAVAAFNRALIEAKDSARRATEKKLVSLRSRLQGTKDALRRLSKSIQLDAEQHKEWEAVTNEAFANALDNLYGFSLDLTGHLLDSQLQTANAEIRSAVDKLAGETDLNRREQLHAVMRMMGKNKAEIKGGLDVIEGMNSSSEIGDALKLAKSDTAAAEKAFEIAYMGLDNALNNPKIQTALKIGKQYGQFATYSNYIVDSAYDVAAEAASWRRIKQLDTNSVAYLAAVKALSARMEDTVDQINQNLRQLQKLR